VIGGHRGRHYGDNAAAVEAEARRQGKSIIWIANPSLLADLRARGVNVLARQSWAARRAISRAPLLIYSHGEDDLDLQLILLRGRRNTCVYLGHSLSLIKAGGVDDPTLIAAWWPVRLFRTWLLTRWDYVLAASAIEREHFFKNYPMNPCSDVHAPLAGASHLDAWVAWGTTPPRKQIYWFPTFRESKAQGEVLREQILAVTSSPELRAWLKDHGYAMLIGAHINDRKAPLSLESPFIHAKLHSLVEDIASSELLISDYSGVIFDFLVLERPQINFAFDEEIYRKSRTLFDEPKSLDFALHPTTTAELVEAIVNERWRADALVQAARKWRLSHLPAPGKSYATVSVRAIESLLT